MSGTVKVLFVLVLIVQLFAVSCQPPEAVPPGDNGGDVTSNGTVEEKRLFPYGAKTADDVYDYESYLFVAYGNCGQGAASHNDLPDNFDCEDFEYTDYRDETELPNPINPQEFYGVRGPGVNRAWQVTTGRPDVVIAVLDSGIQWDEDEPGLVAKYYINRGELPLPQGGPNPDDSRFDGYDINGDGAFNVVDYWEDSRIDDLNENGVIDPEDLIRTFSDSVDDDGNGYVDDISGWDFFENDNNPQDDTDFSHGTQEAKWSAGQAGIDNGICLNCMVMPLRVGDSFITDVNHFAEAAVYAVDNSADVIQEALGTLNHTSFGQDAIDYAYDNGVFVAASAADEAAAHRSWPASYERTTVFNSVRSPVITGTFPNSYLFLNGCTNFGGHTFSSVPSIACSSAATGRAAGMVGLLVSAARNAVERGNMTNYIQDDGTEADFALSAEEQRQLWRLACDDIDFSTPYPHHAFSEVFYSDFRPRWWNEGPMALENQFDLAGTIVETERYQTVRGWDYFTGYGRINAARLVRFLGLEGVSGMADQEYLKVKGPFGVGEDTVLEAQDRIPPEAHIASPIWWRQYGYDENEELLVPDDSEKNNVIVVEGRVAANRITALGGTFDYILEFAPYAQGVPYPQAIGLEAADSEEKSAGPWKQVVYKEGLTQAVEGKLGEIQLEDVINALVENENSFNEENDPTSPYLAEKYAVRLRLRVLAHPVNTDDDVNNEAVHQKQVDVYPAEETVVNDLGRNGHRCGIESSPMFYDLDGDGVDELIVPVDDGIIHAYTDLARGAELSGWPVYTDSYSGIPESGDNAFTRGDVAGGVYGGFLFGGAVAADLDDDGTAEVVMGDLEGKLYVWEYDGSRRNGFPVTVDYSLSRQITCKASSIPNCDDYETGPNKRNHWLARDWAINSAPAVGDLDSDYPGLEIVVGCSDGHVYAWHADGSAVDGWPVILRDPQKIKTMDSVTRSFTYTSDAKPASGTKIITTPSLGDIDGDGDLEVIIGVNEEYYETMNLAATNDNLLGVINLLESSGNTRIYALHHTGANTAETEETLATAHTQDQAYVSGWPVRLAMLVLDLLPYIGMGVTTQPALVDIDGDGTLEIVAASTASPVYVLRHDGTSFYGKAKGTDRYETADSSKGDFGESSCATDGSNLVIAGGVAVGSLRDDDSLSIAGGGGGLMRAVDLLIDGRQIGAEDQLGIWDATTGGFEANAPIVVNDMQFMSQPVIADVTGDGKAEVIQGTAVGDLVTVGIDQTCDSVNRLYTGGWQISSATIGKGGALSGNQDFLCLVSSSREGYLKVFETETPSDSHSSDTALSQWPMFGHDSFNSGNYHCDGQRPGPIKDLDAMVNGARYVEMTFIAPGDDADRGIVDHYQARLASQNVSNPEWTDGNAVSVEVISVKPAGEKQSLKIGPLDPGSYTIMLRAYDEVYNGSPVARVTVAVD